MEHLMRQLSILPLTVSAVHKSKALNWQYDKNMAKTRTNYPFVTFEIKIKSGKNTEEVRKHIGKLLESAFERIPFKRREEGLHGTFYSLPNVAIANDCYRENRNDPELRISLLQDHAAEIPFLKDALERIGFQKWEAPALDPKQARRVVEMLQTKIQTSQKRARRGRRLDEDPNYPKSPD